MKKQFDTMPTAEVLESEIRRVKYRGRYRTVLRTTIYALVTVAAGAILAATLWLPMLQVYGSAMEPTVQDGDIIFAVSTDKPSRGDVVAFYYNNKVLIRRVIGMPGDWVDLEPDGRVCINTQPVEESYLQATDFGDADVELPLRVPDGMYFVMGDNRAGAVDSRHEVLGCIDGENLIGKLILRIWPLEKLGDI